LIGGNSGADKALFYRDFVSRD